MSASAAACPWPLDLSCCCDEWDSWDPCLKETARQTATDVLWNLSGRIYNSACPVEIRPCRPHVGGCDVCGWDGTRWGVAPWIPYNLGGKWFNWNCACQGDCSCGQRADELVLPHDEVACIEQVLLDGEEFGWWALYDFNRLVRTDGEAWPRCQDLSKDSCEEGTWAISYVPGRAVPAAARRMVALLACEIAKSCTGMRCAIPNAGRLTEVTRDGNSWTYDPTAFYTEGLTGIPEIDLWLSAVNPARNRRPSGVYTPHRPPRDRVLRQAGGGSL